MSAAANRLDDRRRGEHPPKIAFSLCAIAPEQRKRPEGLEFFQQEKRTSPPGRSGGTPRYVTRS